MLKKTHFARSERLKEVKHRKSPHPHEEIRSANRKDFVTELFLLLFGVAAPLLKQSAMKMFVVFTVCLSVVVLASAQADQKLKNCNEVRTAYSSKGFNVNDVPNKGVHGELH